MPIEPMTSEENTAAERQDQTNRGTVVRLGALELDVPRSIGYFGAIALAVAFEVVEAPVALFIAAVPLFELLQKREKMPLTRFVGEVLEGAAKPVGGDAEAVIRLAPEEEPRKQAKTS